MGKKGEGLLRIQEEELKMEEVLRDLSVEIGRRFVAWERGSVGIWKISRVKGRLLLWKSEGKRECSLCQ